MLHHLMQLTLWREPRGSAFCRKPGWPGFFGLRQLFFLILSLPLLIGLLGVMTPLPPAHAGEALVRLFGGGTFNKPVQSMKERRMQKVVSQTEDFSCGAAAVATLIRYYFGHTLTERDAILGMFLHGNRDEIRKRGFSMLDMKRFCQNLDYEAQGFKVLDINKLKELKIPVVTLVETRNYKHFVVIRSVDDKYAYLADPSWGNRKVPLEDFEQTWNRVIFVVTGRITGSPEGLYSEAEDPHAPKSEALRLGSMMWNRFSLDPSMSLLFSSGR